MIADISLIDYEKTTLILSSYRIQVWHVCACVVIFIDWTLEITLRE